MKKTTGYANVQGDGGKLKNCPECGTAKACRACKAGAKL